MKVSHSLGRATRVSTIRVEGLPKSRQILALANLVILLSPMTVGAIPLNAVTMIAVAVLFIFSFYALTQSIGSARVAGVALAISSISLMTTSLDLMSRAVFRRLSYTNRPPESYGQPWPCLPLVRRYMPNVSWEGEIFGDIAAETDHKEYREYRHYEFVTDRFGFRNKASAFQNATQDLDLIVLGDSFGMGMGTSQDETWSSMLARDYNLSLYNLSVDGEGPWEEFINLSLEVDRLRTKPGKTIILWTLFPGNDLDDPCHAALKPAELPWSSQIHALEFSYDQFRARSPIRQIRKRAQWKLFHLLSSKGRDDDSVIAREFLDKSTILFLRDFAYRKDRTLPEIQRHQNYNCVDLTIKAMKELASAKRLELVILLVASKEEVYSWVLNHGDPWSTSSTPSALSVAIQSISQRDAIDFVDLKPFFIEESRRAFEQSGELLWWHDDSHWNSRGNKAVASFVYDNVLRSRGTVSGGPAGRN